MLPLRKLPLRAFLAIFLCVGAVGANTAEEPPFVFVMIEYSGGSWQDVRAEQEAHVKAFIPQFMKWLNLKKLVAARETGEVLRLSDARIFNYPLLFITGHFAFQISEPEKQNLKAHLERGGFLFIDDCGGTSADLAAHGNFATQTHQILQGILPEGKWQTLPPGHDVYRFPFDFPNGLPNIMGAENDASPESPGKRRKGAGGEGFFYRNRMVAFFSDSDIGCGWDFNGVGHWGDIPYKVGANVILYALTH
jgi:hypothetical protein